MKTLIIYAHPDHESHAKHTLELVEKKLKEKNINYELVDLYKEKFNPVLPEDEIYGAKAKVPKKEIAHLRSKIDESNHLIFIYPVWWSGMPAILKGFIDRVFSGGYAFKYSDKGIPIGLLKGKKATVFATTGANKFTTWLFLGNRFKKNIAKDILEFCGIKTEVYHTDTARVLDDKQKEKIRKNVENALG
jgi:NAD(P)H dehydrogenase (quinone)